MAAKKSADSKPKKPANTSRDVKSDVVHAALNLAEERGWGNVSMSDIAKRAAIKLPQIHDYFDDRTDILVAYGRIIDRKVLDNFTASQDESHKDILFDLLMERFDVLNENRDAVLSILDSFKLDPKQAVISLPHLGRSMIWMLEAAGIPTGGVKGAVKVAGLSGLYLKTLRTWMRDDSADMGKTMAALDKNLSRAEQWGKSFGLY